jgi:hypothetical protein
MTSMWHIVDAGNVFIDGTWHVMGSPQVCCFQIDVLGFCQDCTWILIACVSTLWSSDGWGSGYWSWWDLVSTCLWACLGPSRKKRSVCLNVWQRKHDEEVPKVLKYWNELTHGWFILREDENPSMLADYISWRETFSGSTHARVKNPDKQGQTGWRHNPRQSRVSGTPRRKKKCTKVDRSGRITPRHPQPRQRGRTHELRVVAWMMDLVTLCLSTPRRRC